MEDAHSNKRKGCFILKQKEENKREAGDYGELMVLLGCFRFDERDMYIRATRAVV
jgi:hypothetical protein